MKIKHFTHTDLDGVGCAILTKYQYGVESVDVTFCEYENINQEVSSFLAKGVFDYDMVLITDISVSEEVAKEIDKHLSNKVQLIDHHPTAEWLNQYEWAIVKSTHIGDLKSSATSLLYEWLLSCNALLDFVEKVRRYDTWEWSTTYDDLHAKQLNDLLYLIGRDAFMDRFLCNTNMIFTLSEEKILSVEQHRIEQYISKKKGQLKPVDILGYHAGVVFAEQYHSELGNELAKQFDELDFIVIINPGNSKISYRGVKENIDLGTDVAARFGGGGHPRTAGSQIEQDLIFNFINSLFEKE